MLQNKRVSLTEMLFNKRHLHQLNKRSHIDDEIYDRWHPNNNNNNKNPSYRQRLINNNNNNMSRHSHLNESFIDLDVTTTISLNHLETTNNNLNTDLVFFYWLGKDYCNAYREDIKECHIHDKDQFERTEVPRMPWRDQGMVVVGESARDLARHFIQRWNHCKVEFSS